MADQKNILLRRDAIYLIFSLQPGLTDAIRRTPGARCSVPVLSVHFNPIVHRMLGGPCALGQIKVPTRLGGSDTHRQVQWMKLEHIPEALQVTYQSINLLSH